MGAQATAKTLTPSHIQKEGRIPWRDRPFQTMQCAAELIGASPASVYGAAARGELSLKKLAGRTLVETSSLIAFIEGAEDWTPSDRTQKAVAARAPRAAQARA